MEQSLEFTQLNWQIKIFAILILLVFFNFLVKTLFAKLQQRFEKSNRFWQASFLRALYIPLCYYVWFLAIVGVLIEIQEHFKGIPFLQSVDFKMLLKVGAVLAISWFGIRWNRYMVAQMILRSQNNQIAMDRAKIASLGKLITLIILFFGLFLLLETTNHSLSALIAFGGVGGLALAFASQEVIANFFGGLMIYVTRPFLVGDWINLPDKQIEGIVEEIGWYMTLIRAFDMKPIYVPNAIFSKMIVITPSRMTQRQFKEVIGLRQQDFGALKAIIDEIKAMLQQHPEVDQRQRIIVGLNGFGNYTLDIRLDFYIKRIDTVGYAEVRQDVLFKIAEIITQNNAKLALPTTSVVSGESAPPKPKE